MAVQHPKTIDDLEKMIKFNGVMLVDIYHTNATGGSKAVSTYRHINDVVYTRKLDCSRKRLVLFKQRMDTEIEYL